jgi:hypothetical protein
VPAEGMKPAGSRAWTGQHTYFRLLLALMETRSWRGGGGAGRSTGVKVPGQCRASCSSHAACGAQDKLATTAAEQADGFGPWPRKPAIWRRAQVW